MVVGLSKLFVAALAILIFGLIGGASTYAQVETDGTTGPRVRLDGPDFEIGADLGARAGRNLFHSFERFSLDAGERATFSGPDEVRNVISRVTGGERSDIDGTLRSTIPGADFYFLNPAGVMFGPNASLDVQGSFHVSTADELRFADGAKFSASNPAASSFTVAAPEAFGFLGAEPGHITVDRSTLEVPRGEAFSIVGGDITIDGGSNGFISGGDDGLVRAAAGTIHLLALDGPGAARIDEGEAAAGPTGARIALADQALVDASGDGGGRIRIHGGEFVLENQSFVFADNNGPTRATDGIEIGADRLTLKNGSQVTADALASGAAGAVRVDATHVAIRSGSFFGSDVRGGGDGGRVTVEADGILISSDGAEGFTGVGTDVLSSNGQGGDTTVRARDLQIRNGGMIRASTFDEGNAGTVTVAAGALEVRGSFITSQSEGGGDAGTVQVEADRLALLEGGQIGAATFDEGDAGNVTVRASELDVRDGDITSVSQGRGDAGTVQVSADRLALVEGGQISSSILEESTGAGGEVRVTTNDSLLISGQNAGGFPSGIFANVEGAADSEMGAGNVTVRAGDLEIRNGGKIASDTFTEGDAGNLTVAAGGLEVRGSFITSESEGGGNAGTVQVSADRLALLEGGQISSSILEESTGAGGEVRVTTNDSLLISGQNAGGFPSGIFANVEGAADSEMGAGNVTVRAGDLEIRNGGKIASDTFTEGDAGNLTVAAGGLEVRGSFITSESEGGGNAGTVQVSADRLALLEGGQISSSILEESTGAGGEVRVTTNDSLLISGQNAGGFPSGIFANVEGAADSEMGAGNVTVRAGELEIRNGGQIASDTFTEGDAGNLTVAAGGLEVRGSFITSESEGGGNAGTVQVSADRLALLEGGQISSSILEESTGAGGEVRVTTNDSLLISGQNAGGFPSGIFANVEGAADSEMGAGNVTVRAGDLEIRNGGKIASDTFTEGDAGNLTVAAGGLEVRGSFITSESEGGGNAGTVQVSADRLALLEGGQISSSILEESTGAGGEVRVTTNDSLLISGQNAGGFPSGIFANVEGAADSEMGAGNVTVRAGELEIRNGGQIGSDTFTEGDAGTVAVSVDDLILSDGGLISSDSFAEGNAGAMTVSADQLLIWGAPGLFTGISSETLDPDSTANAGTVTLAAAVLDIRNGGTVSSAAVGDGDAGAVIVAGDRLLLDRGQITTTSASAGGGEIRLLIEDVINLRSSAVTTSVAGGDDPTAGNILIDPEVLVIDNSTIEADAGAGSGGNIQIFADNILVPEGDLEGLIARGDISATGETQAVSGTVAISAPETDISGGLVVLDAALLDAASQLRERCGARRDIGASSFTGVGRGGLPPSPDGPLASGYLVDEAAVAEAQKVGSRRTAGTAPAGVRLAGVVVPCAPLD